jgi:hypothetical protein
MLNSEHPATIPRNDTATQEVRLEPPTPAIRSQVSFLGSQRRRTAWCTLRASSLHVTRHLGCLVWHTHSLTGTVTMVQVPLQLDSFSSYSQHSALLLAGGLAAAALQS